MRTKDSIRAAIAGDGAESLMDVDVPRWGGKVWIRPPLVDEIKKQEQEEEAAAESTDGSAMGRTYARAVARILCDENGDRIFDPDNEEDIALLMKRRESDLQKVLLAGRDLGN